MRKADYFQKFRLVEVQDTFYNLPREGTAKRWRAEAPEDFEFSLKAWQLITHDPGTPTYRRLRKPIPAGLKTAYGAFHPTPEVFEAWRQTLAIARALQARIVIFQCPPRFGPTPEHRANLRRFFGDIDRGGLILGWEPRGEWTADEVDQLCAELSLIHVVDPLKGAAPGGPLQYFRLHGVTGYRYLHTDEDLRAVAAACPPDALTYVLFNNSFMGEDAHRFLPIAKTARLARAGFAARRARPSEDPSQGTGTAAGRRGRRARRADPAVRSRVR